MPRSLEALSLGFRSVFVIVEVDDTVEADLLGFAVTEVDFGTWKIKFSGEFSVRNKTKGTLVHERGYRLSEGVEAITEIVLACLGSSGLILACPSSSGLV